MKVSDPLIRIFHWSLVTLFSIAFLTGDEIESLHLWAGYAVAALIAFRLLWGASDHVIRGSQISSKDRARSQPYLKQSVRLEAPRHLGHNPAGGVMILLLLATLVGLTVTGFLMTTDAYWVSMLLEEILKVIANGTVVMIGIHILGVIVASFEHGENLVMSMITGRKRAA